MMSFVSIWTTLFSSSNETEKNKLIIASSISVVIQVEKSCPVIMHNKTKIKKGGSLFFKAASTFGVFKKVFKQDSATIFFNRDRRGKRARNFFPLLLLLFSIPSSFQRSHSLLSLIASSAS